MILIDEDRLLKAKKIELKAKLEEFYNSEEFRTFIIMGLPILNTASFRILLSEQIEPLKDMVAKGTPVDQAMFNYISPNGSKLSLTLDQLINIRIKMVISDINPLFVEKQRLQQQVDDLTQEELENWLVESKDKLQALKDSLQ